MISRAWASKFSWAICFLFVAGCASYQFPAIPNIGPVKLPWDNSQDPSGLQTNITSQAAAVGEKANPPLPDWLKSFQSGFGPSAFLNINPVSGITGLNGPVLQIQQPERALTTKANLLDELNLFKKPKTPSSTNQPARLSSNAEKNYAALTNAPAKDKVLHLYRLALWELRRGNTEHSRKLFESALDIVDARFGRSRNAERARGYFSQEAEKDFVGEPYERVMANLYLGFLCLMDGQMDVARACFRNAEWEDSDAEKETYQSDFVIPYYLGGILSDPTDSERWYQSATNSCRVYAPPPPYVPTPNTVLLVEYGVGPTKYLAGDEKKGLQFREGLTTTSGIRVMVGTNSILATTYEDLTFQAITRGGRVMDHILKHKSNVKKGTKLSGWGAVLASQGLILAGADQRVAAGVMVGGWLLQSVSEGVKTQADDRCWDNLPQCLTVATLKLPPGRHVLQVDFLGADGKVQKGATRDVVVNVEESRISAAYVSEHSTKSVQ